MKFYLAARYSRREELCRYRDELRARGDEVTSRWLDGDRAGVPDRRAAEAWADLTAADAMIMFTEASRSAHVLLGAALADGKRVLVVGPAGTAFHSLPAVRRYDTWADCLDGWFGVHPGRAAS